MLMDRQIKIGLALLCSFFILNVTVANAQSLFLAFKIPERNGYASMFDFIVFKDKLYFSCNDGIHGLEFWEYDGYGTPRMVADLGEGECDGRALSKCIFKDKLYFLASECSGGRLAFFDGTNVAYVDPLINWPWALQSTKTNSTIIIMENCGNLMVAIVRVFWMQILD
jgi:ELWxxDGT repeat protein